MLWMILTREMFGALYTVGIEIYNSSGIQTFREEFTSAPQF